MSKIVKKSVCVLLLPLLFCTLFLGVYLTRATVLAQEPEKKVYDAEKEFAGASGEYAPVSGSGGPQWYFQALDMVGFYTYGTGESNPETGELTTNTVNTTLWMYPFVRDGNQGDGTPTEMKNGSGIKNIDYLVQYPAGNGIAYQDSQIGTEFYTSSQQFAKFAGGQWVHPGTNLAVVYSFKVPRAGVVYLKDEIRVIEGGNGVRLSVYHQSRSNAEMEDGRGKAWGGSVAMTLYGAKPVYPEPKVHMQDSGAGWQVIPAGGKFSFMTDNFEVSEGDVLHFILDANGNIANDTTFFAPKVVYGQRPDELLLDKEEVTLAAPSDETAGESCRLTATIRPEGSADKKVTFTSSDEKVATVNEEGLVTAAGEGTALITATLTDGFGEDGKPVTAVCSVTVVPPDDSIEILQSGEELSLEQAYTLQLTYRILPPSSSDKTVIWSIVSQNPEGGGSAEVISLSETGLVTALNAGTATVRAAIDGSEAYGEAALTVTRASDPVLSVNRASVNLVGEDQTQIVTGIAPLFHAGDSVSVTSSDEAVCTAQWADGCITVVAKSAGTATVMANVRDGNSVEITVNVLAESEKVYSWRSGFKTEQGAEWYYYLQKEGDENYSELRYSAAEWGAYEENAGNMLQAGGFIPSAEDYIPEAGAAGGAYNQYLLFWQGHSVHPGKGYNAVLAFRAPLTGTLDFMSYFRMYDERGDGVRVRVLKGSEQIFPAEGRAIVDAAHPVEGAVRNIEAEAGDMFYLIFDCNEQNAFDSCYLDPQFRYLDFEIIPDILKVNRETASLSAGKELLLTVTVTPAENADKRILWSSSDETVASVNSFGIVTAHKTGTVTITAQLEDGSKSECLITVTVGENEGMETWKIVLIVLSCALAVGAAAAGSVIAVGKNKKNTGGGDDREPPFEEGENQDE